MNKQSKLLNLPQEKIPWKTHHALLQVKLTFQVLEHRKPNAAVKLMATASEVKKLYYTFSENMESVCALTCPDCTDVCCKKATIWYDLKDLLCVYFGAGWFPEQQISRSLMTKNTPGPCSCLDRSGCVLERYQRPFVCSWYICPAQTQLLSESDPELKRKLDQDLAEIRNLRKTVEDQFMAAVINPS